MARRLMDYREHGFVAETWRTHELGLRAEAQRLGIRPRESVRNSAPMFWAKRSRRGGSRSEASDLARLAYHEAGHAIERRSSRCRCTG